MEDLESGSLEFPIVGEFLANLKQEFENRDNESVKVKESITRIKDNREICLEVLKFRRAARGSRFEEKPLIKKFKRDINEVI